MWYWDDLKGEATSIFRVACNAFKSTYLLVDNTSVITSCEIKEINDYPVNKD